MSRENPSTSSFLNKCEQILETGKLTVATSREDEPLNELLAYAARNNEKRGYLFVSKVLGKHIPCAPSTMDRIHRKLAAKLSPQKATVFVGMAETATGLGGCVADAYAKINHCGSVYIHSTRYALDCPPMLRFEESHSHAVDHMLYEPLAGLKDSFDEARHAVFVDDEISTGNTLLALAEKYAERYPNIERITFCSLVNWLSEQRRSQCRDILAAGGIQLEFASLVDGIFEFKPHASSVATVPAKPASRAGQPARAREDTGRRGIRLPIDCAGVGFSLTGQPDRGRRLHVIGTGEFMLQPYFYALALENAGYQVAFQSTTRSPIRLGNAINNIIEFADEHGEGLSNYLYNYKADENKQAIVCYEHASLARQHELLRSSRSSAILDDGDKFSHLVSYA